ncbi:uracil-DNA glycosylase [Halalkalibacillus sediminis]|uniref:Uracil-DNA glycosylase n=1 Tax=Halalkalibacillus sediminis TaxID=2018042 RepID=A0A2I0QXW5_9BACI|nr:uracil-DNA glycosylase [Halalkalibacillus sediminis]PKR79165.1 uracil-DNA glycosylase [Halalkalibacillus sediminis]
MFTIPESLANQAQERIKNFPVEGFVYNKGPSNPKIMLVGEAPGEQEIIDGIPFIGRAGRELMASLESIGLSREDVYITSAVRSRPYKWGKKRNRDGTETERKYNRPPTKKEIFAHAPLLDYEIQNLNPKLIVTLGNIGLQRLLGPTAKVTQMHGELIERPIQYIPDLDKNAFTLTDKAYRIVPTFHPASVFYRPSHRESLEADWRRIGEILSNES